MAAGNKGRGVFIGFPTTDMVRSNVVVRCGVFVVNNRHPKPKTKVSIATRKIVDHLEVLHVCNRFICWFGPIMVSTAKL